jgi:hypothetical protein
MSLIKTFIAKYPTSVYFALTFAISWGVALIASGGAGGMRGTTPGSDPPASSPCPSSWRRLRSESSWDT